MKTLFSQPIFKKPLFSSKLFNSEATDTHVEINFLESTGTQYIDTEIIGGCSVTCTYEVTDSTGQYVDTIMGFQNNGSPWASSYLRKWTKGGNVLTYNTFGYYEPVTVGDYDSGVHEITVGFFKDTAYMKYDDTVVKDEAIDAPDDCNSSLYLFAMNTAGTAEKHALVRIYDVQIYSNKERTNLVRDLVPVIRNGIEPCYYDNVTGRYFSNKGTGNFLPG